MRRAIELSRLGFPAPNPRVGCVILSGDTIVGEGFHAYAGGPHAEVVALRSAGAAARGAHLLVTLEPCRHHGRTPPCTEAILQAGIAKVTYAVPDPNPRAAGGGADLANAGISVESGLLEAEARSANRVFLHAMETGRPYVVLKAATTLDGFIARDDGTSKWITGERARERGRLLRAEMGSVLVGRRTVEADDPALTARHPDVKNEPVRAVLDPEARLSGREAIFAGPGEAVWFVGTGSEREARQVPLQTDRQGGLDLRQALGHLRQRGVIGVLVEGGARTYSGFLEQGLVDRIDLFVAPKLFGSGLRWSNGPLAPENWALEEIEQLSGDIRLSYALRRPEGTSQRETPSNQQTT